MNSEASDKQQKSQPLFSKWWKSIERLSLISMFTFAIGLAIALPTSIILAERANQTKLDAMQLALEEQMAETERLKTSKPTEIIHILNRHYVRPEVYATDLKDQGSTLTKKQINKRYSEFLEGVEARQKQQVKLLRRLIKKHKLKAVYVEGLTRKNHRWTMTFVEILKEFEKTKNPPESDFDRLVEAQKKIDFLELGAAGQLVVKGELETLLVTEDSQAFEAANLVRSDGKIVFDKKADERREDAIVRNLLKGSGVVVIVLGEDHDLRDNLKRLGSGVRYKRVGVNR